MRGHFKKRRRVLTGVFVALAATGYVLVSSAPAYQSVDRATKGYMLTPADSIGQYRKFWEYLQDLSTRECEGAPSDADCYIARTEVGRPVREEAIGVKDPAIVRTQYRYGGRTLLVDGFWGTIDDPVTTLDNFFDAIDDDEQEFRGELVGPRERFGPTGFRGALLECQNADLQRMGSVKARSTPTMRVPICVLADHSIVAAVAVVDSRQVRDDSPGLTRSQVARLAADLYASSRTKYWHGVCTWSYCNGKRNEWMDD
ncbi:hypothetical protein M4914_16160 [Streptomyces somaliensis DSM 40738]|uniref:Uncharacterized protein n=1 Tax=Streptomyces somaliensis (strain ATCC 33201 / DSM 40738 / JCM 12659 / KCTC 9044 / NCTC 11332 / NRRL B-12077 / IP 733) TaxID=1134445 RepID=A0AA44DAA1_STRE0|nr:hypothetical protein [Streptomyces somaliensis]MCQ0024341.1 hypothetical protein [Streptomyces somaliensis DSM 40738]NKY12672.1 hypothetical protein [Streptomyces somaliensis DSM 40738]